MNGRNVQCPLFPEHPLTAKELRGRVISALGEVYGTKMRVRCPACGHGGVAVYNFLTDLAEPDLCSRCVEPAA